ncbi:MAG: hypothetical protein WA081_18680 [Desulfosalsimonadaceae bacterium]
MASEIYIGIIFVIIGLLMVVYSQTIGISFCKIGKQIWEKNTKISFFSANEINSMYNEEKAPRIIKILGVANIAQGFFLILFGIYCNIIP